MSIKELEDELDTFSRKNGMAGFIYNPMVDECLSLTYEQMSKMDREECCKRAYILAQYGLFIQKQINREAAKLSWLDENISRIVAKECDNYGDKFVKYEVKRDLVLANNTHAEELSTVARMCRAKMKDFEFIASNIKFMSSILIDLNSSKWTR